MEPVRSNSKAKASVACNSNSTLWTGGDLCSIPVCAGDTTTDIIKKLDQKLCFITGLMDLTDIDLECIWQCLPPCTATRPTTTKAVIQYIIDYLCHCDSCNPNNIGI